MQCKNASEWGKRERLEAEKQSLEEETRKLKMQVKEIKEPLKIKKKKKATLNWDVIIKIYKVGFS